MQLFRGFRYLYWDQTEASFNKAVIVTYHINGHFSAQSTTQTMNPIWQPLLSLQAH